MTEKEIILDINQIKELIPHRYPFLLIDAVTAITEGESITAIKNVTINEPFFQGHFPEMPIMPGALIIESMAQAAVVLAMRTTGQDGSQVMPLFAGIEKARFRKPVLPGDRLRLELEVKRRIGPLWRLRGKAYVEETLAAEATILAILKEV